MPSSAGPKFDRLVAWLRRETGLKFKVRTVVGLGDPEFKYWGTGDQISAKEGWLIKIERNTTYPIQLDALLHEVAHIKDIAKNGYLKDVDSQHTDGFGVEYAALLRAHARWEKTYDGPE